MREISAGRSWQLLLLWLVPFGVQSMFNCTIKEDQAAKTVLGSVDFEFWYAVGLSESIMLDDNPMFELEQLLYASIDEQVLWCISRDEMVEQQTIKEDEGTESSVVSGGKRRQVLQQDDADSVAENRGVLGPILLTPGRRDETTDRDCPIEFQERADQCVVVKGTMRILAVDVDRIELAIWGIRQSLRSSIENTAWQKQGVEGVTFLAYLGDTEDEVFQGGGAGGGFAFISNSYGDNDDGIARVWLLGIPLLLVLILLIAAFTFNQYLRKQLIQERKEPERVVVGTGDHPRSTHRGSYHYSPNGQQYLSSRCEKCLATRREYFYYLNCAEQAGQDCGLGEGVFPVNRLVLDSPKDDCMGTIMEHEPYNIIPVHPDMRTGLAKRHWGNDVHNCGSALCQRCSARTGSPIFVKTRERNPIDPEASEPLDSIWIDPSLRTSPEHEEV